MGSIHYFQRYCQREDVVTNNTLLLLSRLYHYDPKKLLNVITAIADDENLQMGVIFSQQENGVGSRPDGMIVQHPVKILIETKLNKRSFRKEQVKAHLVSLREGYKGILFLLAPQRLSDDEKQALLGKEDMKKPVVSLTFEELILAVKDTISEYEAEMQDVIGDYEEYCTCSGLIDQSWREMELVLASQSLEHNQTHGIYYRGIDKGYRQRKYLGLYSEKAVRAVGRVYRTVCPTVDLENGSVNCDGELNENERRKILGVTEEALSQKGWRISRGHRFFLTEGFYETEFLKTSPRAPMGTKVFDLTEYVKDMSPDTETEEVARALRKKTWQ